MKKILMMVGAMNFAACGGVTDNFSYESMAKQEPSKRILANAAIDWEEDFGKLPEICRAEVAEIEIVDYNTMFEVAAECGSKKLVLGCAKMDRINSKELYFLTVKNEKQKKYSVYNSFAKWATQCTGVSTTEKHRDWARFHWYDKFKK